MEVNIGTEYPDLGTLAAVIAHSQIVVAEPQPNCQAFSREWPLPAGFDEVDVAILEWIAAEGRLAGRGLARL